MLASIVYPYCQKVLPLTYDDSLSYYEEIRKLIDKINEVINTFNSYEEIINELAELVGDISGMQADINTLKSEMNSVQNTLGGYATNLENLSRRDNDLQSQIDALTLKVNSIVSNVNNIYHYIDNAIASVKVENSYAWVRLENLLNTAVRRLQLEIDELINLINELPHDVYNPVHGYRMGFDTNNKTIYHDLRYGGFSNAELSEFGRNNNYVASLVYNNRDYALHAKKRFKLNYLFSPVTGAKVSHANAISQAIISLIDNAVTNTTLYNYMNTNNLTNEDYENVFTTNFERYKVSI